MDLVETTRQRKVSRLLQKELGNYFQRNSTAFGNKIITVTVVRISPDMSVAKIYLSIFPVKPGENILQNIKEHSGMIRLFLGNQVRNQLRIIPELTFFIDDSLDYIEKIDKLLK
jgi:ribosome-binding factor A